MKVTKKEWGALKGVLNTFATSGQGTRTENQTIISNLVARFKQELVFPEDFKP